MIRVPTLLLTLLLWTACNTQHKPKDDQQTQTADPFVRTLVEKQLGESAYYLAIPTNYTISETQGPDFSVYYFYPTDTTQKAAFSGGIYFGNHPHLFPSKGNNCRTEKATEYILNDKTTWTIYHCGDVYSIQTVIEHKNNEDWNQYIHLFGQANATSAFHKLQHIFKTLKKRHAEP